ncbi:hypothetical protein ElyMa_002728900 [Elysia marginata]|uniref:Uncharacterized protein n=1 Tax=Elysia marginata TaxID=1093978 RepID=A0AAV4HJ89_9GAST|nr:hypothetical protein ElyMa_002728900 [Elysia marginata]
MKPNSASSSDPIKPQPKSDFDDQSSTSHADNLPLPSPLPNNSLPITVSPGIVPCDLPTTHANGNTSSILESPKASTIVTGVCKPLISYLDNSTLTSSTNKLEIPSSANLSSTSTLNSTPTFSNPLPTPVGEYPLLNPAHHDPLSSPTDVNSKPASTSTNISPTTTLNSMPTFSNPLPTPVREDLLLTPAYQEPLSSPVVANSKTAVTSTNPPSSFSTNKRVPIPNVKSPLHSSVEPSLSSIPPNIEQAPTSTSELPITTNTPTEPLSTKSLQALASTNPLFTPSAVDSLSAPNSLFAPITSSQIPSPVLTTPTPTSASIVSLLSSSASTNSLSESVCASLLSPHKYFNGVPTTTKSSQASTLASITPPSTSAQINPLPLSTSTNPLSDTSTCDSPRSAHKHSNGIPTTTKSIQASKPTITLQTPIVLNMPEISGNSKASLPPDNPSEASTPASPKIQIITAQDNEGSRVSLGMDSNDGDIHVPQELATVPRTRYKPRNPYPSFKRAKVRHILMFELTEKPEDNVGIKELAQSPT